VGGGSRPRKPVSNAYVVFYGGEVSVFEDWADAQRSTNGHGIAIHAGFCSMQEAQAALEYARSKGWTADSSPPPEAAGLPLAPAGSYEDNPLNAGSSDWYTVCHGVVPSIYRSSLECSLNTVGVKGNLYASFHTRAEAESAYMQALAGNQVRRIARESAFV
jgi:viroplasmin and RNaseH domain-containing protein